MEARIGGEQVNKLGEVIELAKYVAIGKGDGPRVSRCEVCDETFLGTSYICAGCVGTHREAIRSAAFDRLNDSVPERYRDCRFGSERVAFVDQSKAGSIAAASQRGLLITGPAGFGKTTMAVAKLYQAFEQGRRSCMFVSAPELATARRVHPLGDGDAPLVARAMSVGVLVLDDVGKEKQDMSGVVSEVIFHRHAKNKRTIVTASFGVDAARAAYDDGIARRLFEEEWVILGGAK